MNKGKRVTEQRKGAEDEESTEAEVGQSREEKDRRWRMKESGRRDKEREQKECDRKRILVKRKN